MYNRRTTFYSLSEQLPVKSGAFSGPGYKSAFAAHASVYCHNRRSAKHQRLIRQSTTDVSTVHLLVFGELELHNRYGVINVVLRDAHGWLDTQARTVETALAQ